MFLMFAGGAFAFDLSDAQILASGLNSNPQTQQYSLKVAQKIISNFVMPQTDENLATLVVFEVDTNGKLKKYEITQSSGSKDFDDRVIAAIKKSSPYPVPQFEGAEEFAIVLNMDLSIIRLIKMLSNGNLDMKDLPVTPEVKQPAGKKFVNPYDYE